MTVLPASSRFSDLNIPTTSAWHGRTLRQPSGIISPHANVERPISGYTQSERTLTRLSLPFSCSPETQNTSNRHDRDHFALAWPKMPAIRPIRTNPHHRGTHVHAVSMIAITPLSCNAARGWCTFCSSRYASALIDNTKNSRELARLASSRDHLDFAWRVPRGRRSFSNSHWSTDHYRSPHKRNVQETWKMIATLTCCQKWASVNKGSFL